VSLSGKPQDYEHNILHVNETPGYTADFETQHTFELSRRNNFMKTINFPNKTGNYLPKVTGVSRMKEVETRDAYVGRTSLKVGRNCVDCI
jgi:hypothetical protein